MKLTLRARALGKKFTLIFTAYVLAVSTLTASVPFILSKEAGAVSNTVLTTDLSTWDLTETRTTGHNKLVPGGLHVWTEGNTNSGPRTDGQPGNWGTDKAAGYYATPGLKLSDVNSASIEFADGWTGGRPGIQLSVDRDGDGVFDGNLVSEPWVAGYGGDNWWTNKAGFGVSNKGFDYPSVGTLSEYQAANPNANILAIGYSLGSGVKGDVVITKITIGEVNYTFNVAPPVAPSNLKTESINGSTVVNVTNGATNVNHIRNSWSAVSGAASYNYEFTKPGGLATYTRNTTATSVEGEFHGAVSPTGVYSFRVQSVSAEGQLSGWSSYSSVAYDTGGPAVSGVIAQGKSLIGNSALLRGEQTTFSVSLADDYAAAQSAYVELFKAKVGDGYSNGFVASNAAADKLGANPRLVFNTQDLSGRYGLKITATDSLGNKKDTFVYFTVDNVAPQAPVLTAKNGSGSALTNNGYTTSYNVTVDWTLSADATSYTYKYWNDIPGNRYKADAPYEVPSLTQLSTSGVFDQGEGKHYMQVVAYDAAGNAAPSNVFAVTYDKSAPTVEALSLSRSVVSGGSLQVNGTITDANLKSYTYQIVDAQKKNVLGEYSWSKNVTTGNVTNGTLITANVEGLKLDGTTVAPLPEGNYYVRVWADDLAGNRTGGVSQIYLPFTVDKSAPTISGVDDGVAYRGNVTFSVSDENFDYVTVNGSQVAPSGEGNTYTVSGNGDYAVVAYDKAGNPSGEVTFTIDNSITVEFGPVNSQTSTPQIRGTATYNALGQNDNSIAVDGVELDVYVGNVRYSVTTANGEWNFPVTVPLVNGTYVLSVTLADQDDILNEETFLVNVPVATSPIGTEGDDPTPPANGDNDNNAPNGGLPFATFGAAGVLGLGDDTTSNADTDEDADVEGISTANTLAAAAENTDGKAFGLAWYWWLLIIAAVASAIWWLVGAVRNRQAE